MSVIVPFFNLQDYVRETIDSVVAAVRRLHAEGLSHIIQLVCVDDGSTDATGSIIDSELAQLSIDGFECVCIHQNNQGEGMARNAGLGCATGDWITFLDGDDIWAEDYFVQFLDLLNAYPDADVIRMQKASFRTARPSFDRKPHVRTMSFCVSSEIPQFVLANLGVFPTFIRKRVADGIKFAQLVLGADRVYMADCIARARQIVMSDVVVYGYRHRSSSMAHCASNVGKIMSYRDYVLRIWEILIKSNKKMDAGCEGFLMAHLMLRLPIMISHMGNGEVTRKLWTAWLDAIAALSPLPHSRKWRLMRRMELAMASSRFMTLLIVRMLWRLGVLGVRRT